MAAVRIESRPIYSHMVGRIFFLKVVKFIFPPNKNSGIPAVAFLCFIFRNRTFFTGAAKDPGKRQAVTLKESTVFCGSFREGGYQIKIRKKY